MAELINVKITTTKGHPRAIFRFTNDLCGFRVQKSWKRKIKTETDAENGNVLVYMPIALFHEFIEVNKSVCGNYDEVKYDQGSIERYYGFECGDNYVYSTNLTENFINNWRNYDCPDLVRFSVNINNEKNGWGISLLVFEDILFQWDYSFDATVDELYEDEYKAFENAMGKDNNSRAWNFIKEAWMNQHSDANIDEILDEVVAYEQKIQKVIDAHSSAMEKFAEDLPRYEFDCGFHMIYTRNDEISRKIRFLKSKGKRSVDYLSIRFPGDYFSVTNTREIFNYFKSIAENPIVAELYIQTRLD